jgi:hypothetical protein
VASHPPIPLNSVLEAQMACFEMVEWADVCFKEGFNGDDPAVPYLKSCSRDLGDRQMHAQTKIRRGHMIPVVVAATVAVVGQTVILFNDFGAGNDSHGRGEARMITAAVVSKAGAIEMPSQPDVGRPIS